MRAITASKVLAASAANNICQSQSPGGAGNLTINGSLASGGVATTDTVRVVGITSTGNDSGNTFTVYGTNYMGNSISEVVTGPNTTTVSTTNNFATVTRIAISGASVGAITVGTTGVGSTWAIPMDQYISPFAISLFFKVSGTVNCTVQYTSDDVFAAGFNSDLASWTDHPNLTSKSANTDSNLAYPASAVRLKLNSGSGTGTLIIRQAGIGGT